MVRRSTRTKSKPVQYKETDSSEDERSGSEIEEEEEKEKEEEEYTYKSSRSNKRSRKPSNYNKQSKRLKQNNGKSVKAIRQMEDNMEENYLFEALMNTETNISDLALDWLESYEEEVADSQQNEAITNLINLILRSCGSLHLFQPHDLINLESCDETTEEITIAFGQQTSHKWPYKALPTFKKNVAIFFTNIIELSHEKGLLYNEDKQELSSDLMSYILTWISCLTTTTIRSLRYTSVEILMLIQIELCRIIKTVSANLERTENQLNRLKDTTKAKYKSLNETSKTYKHEIDTITDYFQDITKTVIDNRYKDVDPQIRLTCLKDLNESMIIFPQFFCQGVYLRYFGWSLTDSISQVRVENSKVLLRLYKSFKNEVPLGLQQFSEKYKSQFVKMSQIDSDLQVKLNCFGILNELLKRGFLDEEESKGIIQAYPFDKNIKLQIECSKFIELYNNEEFENVKDKYDTILIYKNDQNLSFILKMKLLINSCKSVEEGKPLSDMFVHIASEYNKNWELLVDYFLLDVSSLKFNDENDEDIENEEITNFQNYIELQLQDKIILLQFINGYFKYILNNKKITQEIVTNQLTKLIEHLPRLGSECLKEKKLFISFLNLWTELTVYQKDSIFNLFNKLDKIEQYEDITKNIFKYFKESNLSNEFNEYFIKVFEPSKNVLTTNCKSFAQTSLQELVEEINQIILDEDNEETESYSEIEMNEQKTIIQKINKVSPLILKLKQIGDFINITNLTNISDLIDNLTFKIFKKLHFSLILSNWKQNFLAQTESFENNLSNLFDFILTILSWKFEKLMEVQNEKEQKSIAIDLQFDNFVDLINEIIKLIYDCQKDKEMIQIKTILILKYIEFISSFKFFYVKYQNNNEFENFKQFFQSNIQLILIKRDLQFEILELFLIKENQLGHELNVELDRNDDEGVNYDDYIKRNEHRDDSNINAIRESSLFDDDDDDNETQQETQQETQTETQKIQEQIKENRKRERIWKYEKELALLTLKIISLFNLGLVQEDIWQRLELNSGKLGDVYKQIINQQQKKIESMKEHSGNADNNMEDLNLDEEGGRTDPIEENVGKNTSPVANEEDNNDNVDDSESLQADHNVDGHDNTTNQPEDIIEHNESNVNEDISNSNDANNVLTNPVST
ncbi:unnamed protein product [Candida verbasci]|uniref:SCD domain-containing protein n=1 Tax=Candida verbasci TaxID=1227364 RepID=A0A9W4TT93_9ASCO|nr:unnamed protein product [Candida verbasci]